MWEYGQIHVKYQSWKHHKVLVDYKRHTLKGVGSLTTSYSNITEPELKFPQKKNEIEKVSKSI